MAKGEETNGIGGPQPAAANMKRMVWNNELEAIAQRWADQCTWGHDDERLKLDGTKVGQNMYRRGGGQETYEQINEGMSRPAQKWYDEVATPGFNSNNIKPFVYVRHS